MRKRFSEAMKKVVSIGTRSGRQAASVGRGARAPHLDLVSGRSGRIIAACINKQEW
ncbi:hypothetical protein AH4AK4_0146 [Aeromonas hydrophila 4AK4]|nr:hypothetical protein AH4AK4_0146 [Aeromonas hydrophila 4AK4]